MIDDAREPMTRERMLAMVDEWRCVTIALIDDAPELAVELFEAIDRAGLDGGKSLRAILARQEHVARVATALFRGVGMIPHTVEDALARVDAEHIAGGVCPVCGDSPYEMRERRLNGNSRCKNGHTSPNRTWRQPGESPDDDPPERVLKGVHMSDRRAKRMGKARSE